MLKAIQATEENTWRENLTSKGVGSIFGCTRRVKVSCWYRLLQPHPFIGTFVATILRLLSNSFLVNRKRINACLAPYDCNDCGIVSGDPVAHAVLACNAS